MPRILIVALACFCLSVGMNAQHHEFEFHHWPVYYPFEDGIQMIEIRFGISDLSLARKAQTYKANPYVYIFRNASGKILHSYNLCDYPLSTFKLKPPGKAKPNETAKHNLEYYPIFNRCSKSNHVLYGEADMSKVKYGLVNRKGQLLIKPKYDQLTIIPYSDVIVAIKGEKAGFISRNDDIIQPFEFDANPHPYVTYSNVPIIVRKDKKYMLVNRDGKITNGKEYDYIDGFWSNKARMKLNGKFGFLDTLGKEIIPPIYDHAENFYKNATVVQSKGKYGIIDSQGKIIQKIKYDRIENLPLGPNMMFMGYKAFLNGKEYEFDTAGQDMDSSGRSIYIEEYDKYIKLDQIQLGDITMCQPPIIIKKIQINGKGSKEILILRKCSGTIEKHGGTFDISERFELEQYEVWNIDSQKQLFKATSRYSHNFRRFDVYSDPIQSEGGEGYQYIFDMDENGIISISKTKQYPKKNERIGNRMPDHKEGVYQFKNGKYRLR